MEGIVKDYLLASDIDQTLSPSWQITGGLLLSFTGLWGSGFVFVMVYLAFQFPS